MKTTLSSLYRLPARRFLARQFWRGATCIVIMVMLINPAQGAFHLWSIRELYTDASGDLQFIEFFTSDFSQQFVGGQQIQSRNVGNTITHTFTIPSNLPGDTANRAFLIGTAGIDPAGGPAPDFVIPTDFLFPAGGTITFFGTPSSLTYSALPTDGVGSRNANGSNNPLNSAQNFAGQVGTVVAVPEPATMAFLGLGILGALWAARRRV